MSPPATPAGEKAQAVGFSSNEETCLPGLFVFLRIFHLPW